MFPYLISVVQLEFTTLCILSEHGRENSGDRSSQTRGQKAGNPWSDRLPRDGTEIVALEAGSSGHAVISAENFSSVLPAKNYVEDTGP